MHGGRTFIWLYFLSLFGLPEGFITDRILLSVFVSRQCPFSLALSFDCLREKYLTIQIVKFMLQKPIYIYQSLHEANQFRGQPSSQSMDIGCFLARGKSRWGVNQIFPTHVVRKLKVSEAIPQVLPHAFMVCTVTTFTFCVTEQMFKKFTGK